MGGFGAYMTMVYVLSLRGGEGLLVDLGGLIRYQSQSTTGYLVVTLLGKIKGEHRDRCHILPCSKRTKSGIDVGNWVNRLVQRHQSVGRVDGPAITDIDGKVMSTKSLEDYLVELLEELYDENPSAFPPSIGSKDDIGTGYQVFRSLRRSSDTRALEMNVSQSDIDIVNRWHTVEAAKGNRPSFPMQQHYAQVELLLQPFIRYTGAM
jgi:hypothetical protein